jgi:hypothetical protein
MDKDVFGRRVGRVVAADRTVISVTRTDERYGDTLADCARETIVAQPANRGTERLAVLPVTGIEWNDLGSPERVAMSRERASWQLAIA